MTAHSNAPFRAGTAISQTPGGGSTFFGGSDHNERAGDFAIFTGSCNQRILFGNVGNQTPCIGVESNALTVRRRAESTSLRLVLGDDFGATSTSEKVDAYRSSNAANYASNMMIAVDAAASLSFAQFPALSNAASHASNQLPSLSNAAAFASNLFVASGTGLATSNLSASDAVVAGTLSASNVSTAALSASNAWVAGDARVTGTLTAVGGLTVDGDLVINGSNVFANAQQVVVRDNVMVLNSGQVGAGVSAGQAGIRVDRGTACNVDLVFDETVGMFRVGIPGGDLETIATRPWVDDSVAPFRDAAFYASNQRTVVGAAAFYASNQWTVVGDAASFASNRVPAAGDAAFSASNRVQSLGAAALYASSRFPSLSNAASSGYGVFGLSTSNYSGANDQLSFGNTQFSRGITNNGTSIVLHDAGVYAFTVILDSRTAATSSMRVICKYWDGSAWVQHQSCEDGQTYANGTAFVMEFVVQSMSYQSWAMFFNGPSWTYAPGTGGDWWSRWMVRKVAASYGVGRVLWAARAASALDDNVRCMSRTPADGGFILSGRAGGGGFNVYAPNSTSTSIAVTTTADGFAIRYDPTGVAQWACVMRVLATPILSCTLSDGSFYAAGAFTGATLTLLNSDGTSFAPIAKVGTGVATWFVARYSATGFVQWVAAMPSTQSSSPTSICCDDSGVVVMGAYTATVVFRSSAGVQFSRTLTADSTQPSVFIVKYSPSGDVQWVNSLSGSTVAKVLGQSSICATSADGGYYATAIVTTGTNIYSADGSLWKTIAVAGDEIVTIKMSANGAYAWSSRVGTLNGDNGMSVCYSDDGYVYVSGYYYNGTCTAYNADGTAFGTKMASAGNNDGCVVKYSLSGVVQWVAKMGSSGDDRVWGMCPTSDGGVCVTGYYKGGPVSIVEASGAEYSSTLALTPSSANDAFVVKLTGSGAVDWAARCGGGLSSKIGVTVCPASEGGVFVAGLYNCNPLTLYHADATAYNLTLSNSGSNDIFVARYS